MQLKISPRLEKSHLLLHLDATTNQCHTPLVQRALDEICPCWMRRHTLPTLPLLPLTHTSFAGVCIHSPKWKRLLFSRPSCALGYAYVNFQLGPDGARAIDVLNFQVVNGKPIRIMNSQSGAPPRTSGVGNRSGAIRIFNPNTNEEVVGGHMPELRGCTRE